MLHAASEVQAVRGGVILPILGSIPNSAGTMVYIGSGFFGYAT